MDIYAALEFPAPPLDRPYVFINMVTTIDGKSVVGSRDDDVQGLGSRTDHLLMTRIEAAADAVLVGAQTLRATSPRWNPRTPKRVVVTRTGALPLNSRFLTDGESFVALGRGCPDDVLGLPDSDRHPRLLPFDSVDVDLRELLRRLRAEHGVTRLVVMGGSELNAELLRADLADELFLTIAPKIKLGREVATYAGGDPLPRDEMTGFSLIEHHVVGDEVFLRYRRNKR